MPRRLKAMPMLARTWISRSSTTDGRTEGVGDALGHVAGLVGVDDLLHEDGELIPAEPGRRVPSPQAVAQPAGHFDQEGVSGGVTEAVVHQLEVVEVEEEHGQ